MVDDAEGPPDGRNDKLIRAKQQWAREGRLLTGITADPARDRLPPGQRLVRDIRLSNLMPHDACAVQCTYFTKSSAHNWLVTLHQDLSIPVADRIDSEHCTGWSRKEGGLFVQPPSSFLENMLAVRIHLDDTDDESGALRVVPGSHAMGRLTTEAIQRVRN